MEGFTSIVVLQVQAAALYSLRAAQLHAIVDSNRLMKVALVQALMPGGLLSFTFCAELDYSKAGAKSDFAKIGYGFNIGAR